MATVTTIQPATPSTASTRKASKLYAWMPRGVLGMVMVITGAAGLVYEYILSTVNTYLMGNSILQFSITIGLMCLSMGAGSHVQKYIEKGLAEAFVFVELLLVLLGGFAPIAMQWVFSTSQPNYPWIMVIYVCLVGFLIGIEIPIIVKINQNFTSNLGDNIAGTWAWDYVGGAVGVVGWVWLLQSNVPLTHISFFVAACNFVAAIMALVFFWRRGLMSWKMGGVISAVASMLVIGMTAIGFIQVDVWSKVLSQKLYEDPIVFQEQTKYQQIVMTETANVDSSNGSTFELFLNGNKQFNSSDEKIYHELLVHPAMNLAARHERVLVLGGGDGMALREIVKYPGVKEVSLVDLDPGMIELARTNPLVVELNGNSFADARVHSSMPSGVQDTGSKREVLVETGNIDTVDCPEATGRQGERQVECVSEPVTESIGSVNVFTIDADQFVSAQSGPWDVVIVDLPDPNSIELAKLYSLEFYNKIKRNMSPDGIVVVQSTSPYHAKETYLCIMRTMADAGLGVVPYHENVPSFGDWGWIIGSPSMTSNALANRAQSLDSFPVDTLAVDNSVFHRSLIFNKGALTSTNNEISTLLRPTVFNYYTYEA
ncbi:MAG TPA: polyamine aminopropyltransferase, partial [Candidatus Saccharimonadales bacterium]|nr:polyamine aminopropyltransferase [Candidatus Saccharimonadales bacterium]